MRHQKILISACLLGQKVRYNGRDLLQDNAWLDQWQEEGRLVAFCPEVAGGLPIPRDPAEIVDGTAGDVLTGAARIMSNQNEDVTTPFIQGAKQALAICQQHNIGIAILTESSPSCGSKTIYDGTFSSTKIRGEGVTAALLRQNGIQVFSQFELNKVVDYYQNLHS